MFFVIDLLERENDSDVKMQQNFQDKITTQASPRILGRQRCMMKKLALSLIVLSVFLLPTLLLAQPPRPRGGDVPHGRPVAARHGHHGSMQVHVPPRPEPVRSYHRYETRRPPMPPPHHHGHHHHYPPVVRPGVVVVPQVVTPYYVAPAPSGFSLSIGGHHGGISVYSGF